jgi:Antitoxin Phd_YefM, type II toxin-antitoxin system
MAITTISSRKFNQDASGAKKAAAKGPVFITDRGHAAHVLLTIEQYQKLTGKTENIVDLIAMPRSSKIDFEPPKLKGRLYRPADFD